LIPDRSFQPAAMNSLYLPYGFLLVKLITSSASQEVYLIFFGKRSFSYSVQNSPPFVCISGLQNDIKFNITPLSMPSSSQFSLSGFPTKSPYAYLNSNIFSTVPTLLPSPLNWSSE
jgi:hypothetical protein